MALSPIWLFARLRILSYAIAPLTRAVLKASMPLSPIWLVLSPSSLSCAIAPLARA